LTSRTKEDENDLRIKGPSGEIINALLSYYQGDQFKWRL
jgi:hypothetical protein